MRKERRLQNLKRLIDTKFKGVAGKLAEKIDRQPSYVYRLFTNKTEHKRGIGDDLADEIEKKCELPPYWLDQPDGLETLSELAIAVAKDVMKLSNEKQLQIRNWAAVEAALADQQRQFQEEGYAPDHKSE